MATSTHGATTQERGTSKHNDEVALRRVMGTCPLFRGVDSNDYDDVLAGLGAYRRSYDTGEILVHIGERLTRFGIVLTGKVEIDFYDEEGNPSSVARMGQSGSFAEAIAFSKLPSIVQVTAQVPTRVIWLEVSRIMSQQAMAASPYAGVVMANVVESLARKNMLVNRKMQVVAQKRLRDRIKLYLAVHEGADEKNGSVGAGGASRASQTASQSDAEMSRAELARYLSVDRSALSRELGRMRDEGLIRLDGKKIVVLDRRFLES